MPVSTLAYSDVIGESYDVCGDDIVCVDQGWSQQERSWWYTTTQGSRLMPLTWALALEAPDSGGKLFDKLNMERYGYLSNTVSKDNPYGLPIGFAIDHRATPDADIMCEVFTESCLARTMREPWVGLNCAACHTAEIEFGERRIRIEGAPALADFEAFTADVSRALLSTLASTAKFDNFAREVLAERMSVERRSSLRRQISEQVDWLQRLASKNAGSVAAGHGRLDAQGHIFNKVSLVVGAENHDVNIPADAPASYPFIWNTHQQDKLQWNGIAPNVLQLPIKGKETDLGALIRNTSEVIGVFAQLEADRGSAVFGYSSSVRVRELVDLERQLAKLQSPRWPEQLLTPIDWELAADGLSHFKQHCKECHQPLDPSDLTTQIEVEMIPLKQAGTDPFLACNTFTHRSEAGNMAGQRALGLFGERIAQEDVTRKMLANAAVGAILGKLDELLPAIFVNFEPVPAVGMSLEVDLEEVLPDMKDNSKREQIQSCLRNGDSLLAYKARPLNGVWATAPYLHNGSVPTLYDLLLPSSVRTFVTIGDEERLQDVQMRPERFGVGSRIFDPEKVGFVSDPTENPFVFEVRRQDGEPVPGNLNSGHNYGADLTDLERRELLEYLKTL